MVKHINTDTYYHQPQQILLVLLMDATCFGRVEHPEALKYITLNTRVQMHRYILKFARSHKLYELLQILCGIGM